MDWGQEELFSPVVRDTEVTRAARRKSSRKVAFPSPRDDATTGFSTTPESPLLRHNPVSLYRQTVTPKSSLRNPDVSAILGTGARTPRFLHTPRSVLGNTSLNLNDSDWTNSLYPSPLSGLGDTTSFSDDIINLSSEVLKEEDPGEAASCSLFREFLEFLKTTAIYIQGAGLSWFSE
ncbi:nuclear pore complex protein Nup107 [Aplochiton taeniatus]